MDNFFLRISLNQDGNKTIVNVQIEWGMEDLGNEWNPFLLKWLKPRKPGLRS